MSNTNTPYKGIQCLFYKDVQYHIKLQKLGIQSQPLVKGGQKGAVVMGEGIFGGDCHEEGKKMELAQEGEEATSSQQLSCEVVRSCYCKRGWWWTGGVCSSVETMRMKLWNNDN